MVETTARRTKADFDDLIENIKEIISEVNQKMSLRQIYYQLVARNLFDNKLSNYKMLSSLLVKARKSGIIDYDDIEDRTRKYKSFMKDEDVESVKDEAQSLIDYVQYKKYEIPLNFGQRDLHIIVCEKQALETFFEQSIRSFRESDKNIIMVINRGYNSLTQIKTIADQIMRVRIIPDPSPDMKDYIEKDSEEFPKLFELMNDSEVKPRNIIVSYFGDFDPSGFDIERNFKQQLEDFDIVFSEFERIGLTEEQIKHYLLPTAPVKESDSRSKTWEKGGCVELDALPPADLSNLIFNRCQRFFDEDLEIEIEKLNKLLDKDYKRLLFEGIKDWVNNTAMEE